MTFIDRTERGMIRVGVELNHIYQSLAFSMGETSTKNTPPEARSNWKPFPY